MMDEELKKAGFDINKLTKEQKYLIMEPSYAPENYHHDGEVTPQEAFDIWTKKMVRAKIDPITMNKAIKLHFAL